MFMLALMLASSGRVVEGQALPALVYEAPATCPDQAFFAQRMRARLRADGVQALTSLSLRVTLEPSRHAVRGVVEISRGATRAQRTLDGDSCREVVEGLALIAALAVAAPATTASDPTKPRPPVQSPRAEGRSRARSKAAAARESPPPAAAATADLEVNEPAPQEAKAPPPAPPRVVPATHASPTDAVPSPPERASADPHETRVRGWSLGAAALALHGGAPAIRPGLQLQAAVVLAAGSLDWSVRAGARIALDDRLQSSQGTARFGLVTGVLQLCATGALGSSGLSLAGCAVAEPGILSARGDNTLNSQAYKRAWLAAGAGVDLGWRVAGWLALHAGAEILVPTQLYRMLLAGTLLHEVPPACLRLQLGVEVPLG